MSTPVVPEGADAKDVRDSLRQSAQEVIKLRSLSEDQRPSDFAEQVRSHVNFIHEFDAVEKALAKVEPRETPKSQGPSAAFGQEVSQSRSIGAQFTSDEEYQSFARAGRSNSGFTEVTLDRSLMRATIAEGTLTSGIGTDAGGWLTVGQPIPPRPRQARLFVRDLVANGTTGLASVPYIQETNPVAYEGGASAVAEGTAKPEVEMHWTRKDAPVRKIAAWVPVTNEIIEDAPTLRSYIDERLLYMIALREEREVIAGDGTGAHLGGILSQSGVQLQTAVSGDLPATIAASIAKIELVDGEADGVALNPLDFWTAIATRHSSHFDNGYGGNAPALVSSITWGLPVVRTRSLAQGAGIVGSWRLGATLFDREQSSIRVGNQHSDFFTNNKVAILGEERIALAVHRPDLFVSLSGIA